MPLKLSRLLQQTNSGVELKFLPPREEEGEIETLKALNIFPVVVVVAVLHVHKAKSRRRKQASKTPSNRWKNLIFPSMRSLQPTLAQCALAIRSRLCAFLPCFTADGTVRKWWAHVLPAHTLLSEVFMYAQMAYNNPDNPNNKEK